MVKNNIIEVGAMIAAGSKLLFPREVSLLPFGVSVLPTQFSELPATALTSKFAFHTCHSPAFQAKTSEILMNF